jgi:hypothetical protein
MTHAKKDCLERPRKIGAKFTNSNFAPDEFVQPNLSMSFDGKRDRWNGYDNFQHQVMSSINQSNIRHSKLLPFNATLEITCKILFEI